MRDCKPPLSYGQQVDLLRSRGLEIVNRERAEDILSRVNYYRLIGGYAIGLTRNNQFNPGTTIESLEEIYLFDVGFRKEIFSLIELFEVEFRTAIAYHIAMEHGPLGYLSSGIYHNQKYYNDFVKHFDFIVKTEQPTHPIVRHHNDLYGGKIPVWAAVELMPFGTLSKIYRNLKDEPAKKLGDKNDRVPLRKQIAQRWGNLDPKYLSSWAHSLTEVRNRCAHFGRLYNFPLNKAPYALKRHKKYSSNKIFPRLIVLSCLLHTHTERVLFVSRLQALIDEYSPSVRLDRIGFPPNWENVLLNP